MVRNRTLFTLLVLTSLTMPPAIARQQVGFWIAQAPPELTPAFMLPADLPENTALSIDGSITMAVITRRLTQSFEQRFPNATVAVQYQGTEAALQALLAGSLDLAAVGRPLTDTEKAQGLQEVPISREKIAVIVGKDNLFQGELTFEDFAAIFRGEITNWATLGGADLPIRFIDRPADSDTRSALSSYAIFQAREFSVGETAVPVASDETAAVVAELGSDGIGYGIASQVTDQNNVRIVPLNGTLTDDPRYPYSQPRSYVYKGTPSPAVEAFLAFATTAEGQAVVAQAQAAEAAEVAVAELPQSVLAPRPNGEGFITGDRSGNINFWHGDGTPAGLPVQAHIGPVTALDFTTDGQRILSGGADGRVRFWDAIGTPVGEPIAAHTAPVTGLAALPDGNFVSASADGTLQRWDNLGNSLGEPIPAHGDTIRGLALAPDGASFASVAEDGTLKLWNADGTPKTETPSAYTAPLTAIAFTPDGSLLSGSEDGTLQRWDAAGAPLPSQMQSAGPINDVAVSPDGQRFVSGDQAGNLQLWTPEGVALGAAINDVGAPVDAVAFTPDGGLLVSAGDTPPQVRTSTGEVSSAPGDGQSGQSGLPPELAQLWQRIRALPPQAQWIIPLGILAVLLLLLLQSLRATKDDLDEEDGLDDLEPDAEGRSAGDAAAIGEPNVPMAMAAVSPHEAASSLDTRLSRAKNALSRGLDLTQSGRLQDALESFNQAIEAADVERLKALAAGVSLTGTAAVIASGLARRGRVLAALGRSDTALQSFDRALEIAPDSLDAWVGKGNLLLGTNRPDEALFCFDKAIELNPNIGAAWYGKAQALQKLNREAEARTSFAQAETLGGRDDILVAPILEDAAVGTGTAAALGTGIAALGAFGGRSQTEPRGLPIEPLPSPGAEATAPPLSDAPLPEAVAEAVADLPETPDTPDPHAPMVRPIAVPEEVQAIITAEQVPPGDIPEAVQAAVADLPEQPDVPQPSAPPVPPIAVPPEVQEILFGSGSFPATGEEDFAIAVGGGDRPTEILTPPEFSTGRGNITPLDDLPEPSISPPRTMLSADIPPEVLAALEGIPEDSPDRFDVPSDSLFNPPSTTVPPPPPRPPAPPPPPRPPAPPLPSNPKLKNP